MKSAPKHIENHTAVKPTRKPVSVMPIVCPEPRGERATPIETAYHGKALPAARKSAETFTLLRRISPYMMQTTAKITVA
jgi:hypothetical protein